MNSDVTPALTHLLADGSVSVHLEQESTIQIKTISKFNDPVELLPSQARELARILVLLADKIDEEDET